MTKLTFTGDHLLRMSEDEVWSLPETYVTVVPDDGDAFEISTHRIKFFWYVWNPLRFYPEIHFKRKFIGEGEFNQGLFLKTASAIREECIRHILYKYDAHNPRLSAHTAEVIHKEIWESAHQTYLALNNLYNAVETRIAEYAPVFDYIHIAECIVHPEITEAKRRYMSGEDPSVDNLYAAVTDVMFKSPDLNNNELARSLRSGSTDIKSVLQIVASRGNAVDASGEHFHEPVRESYDDGLNSMYSSMVENRGVIISLSTQSGPLEQSEYTGRITQLAATFLSTIKINDCGTDNTMPWVVERDMVEFIVGSFMRVGNKDVEITHEIAKSHVGETVNLRNVSMCNELKHGRVCRKCLGLLSWFIHPESYAGIELITPINAKITQSLLGIKHILQSSTPDKLTLPPEADRFIKLNSKDNWVVEISNHKALKYPLMVHKDGLVNINRINTVNSVYDLTPDSLSCIRELHFCKSVKTTEAGKLEVTIEESIVVESNGIGSSFSYEFLEYIRDNGYENVDDYFVIDMENWNGALPLLNVPRRKADTKSLLREFSQFFFRSGEAIYQKDGEGEAKQNDIISIVNYKTPGAAIKALADILMPVSYDGDKVKRNVEFNIAQLSALIAVCMCRDPDNGDYRLPLSGQQFKFVDVKNNLLMSRTISVWLEYQGQKKLFTTAAAFNNTKRQSHGFDRVFD